ncbi:MAG TPA: NAD+ synthase [Solirubrobacterales bacterium]|nr:NAD+ synthase [Solirubrobacterales bacterium]
MRIALAQINPTVGDVDGNAAKIAAWIDRARAAEAELAIFPELCVPGYPAEDLYLKRHFLAANVAAVERLAAGLEPGITVLVGFAEPVEGGGDHRHAYNSLAVLADGAIRRVYRKNRLPNYAVFDEQRYFVPGSDGEEIEVAGTHVGLTICEDTWAPGPPGQAEADAGARLIANPSGSPYHRGKGHEREEMFGRRAREYGSHFAFVNLVGGQDELVFDGQSLLLSPDGTVLARAAQFEEELLVVDVPAEDGAPGQLAEPLSDLDEVYGALRLGLHDYVEKNGFGHVGLGISGGIDSALVAMLAVDALGPERVTLVVMPSPHSSAETQADARQIAHNLGTALIEIPIEPMMDGYRDALEEHLRPDADDANASPTDPTRPSEPDLAAENIQARIRGNLMMALSNRHGWLVLTTGNKSEMSVGYATLYGDMAGGFAVIKDVPKTLVYELVERRNERAGRELVPAAVIERPPSAELRPDQLDSDSLPDYDLLDRILEAYVERDEGRDEMVAAGLPGQVVDEVIRLVDRAEYKRRQAAPGIRITPRAFGRDRRLPITNRFGG